MWHNGIPERNILTSWNLYHKFFLDTNSLALTFQDLERTRNILFSITLAINSMLLFLLLFEDRIVLPGWLQVTGRMHPMFLHFPIVLVVLYALWVLFFQKRITPPDTARALGEGLLLLSAFTSALTALMGLFLSREEGYDPEALLWHKWGGVAVSLMLMLWYAFRKSFGKTRWGTVVLTLYPGQKQ